MAQDTAGPPPERLRPAQRVLRASPQVARTFVRPARSRLRAPVLTASSTVVTVNYTGFTPQAQAAFQFAVDEWKTQIATTVPVVIDATFAPLGAGVLGQAGPTYILRDFSAASLPSTWYPVALANKLAATDLAPFDADIEASFSSTFVWYYGTDGAAPPGTYDFVTVVLHELGHGLGFIGSGTVSGSQGAWGFGTATPAIYDRFVSNTAGESMLNTTLFPINPSATLAAYLTHDLRWIGAHGLAAMGEPPHLYAPATWRSGSSFSHLDEGSYPASNPNSLMTPFLSSAEAIHDPGPIVRGMFLDMGWSIETCTASLSSGGRTFSASGGVGTVVLSMPPECPWSAASAAPWVTITSPADASGSALVTFSVAANGRSVTRVAQLTIGGLTFIVTQAGVPCSYSLTPAQDWISGLGGSRTVFVTASDGVCSWTASSNAAWLVGSSGVGSATLTYVAAANPAPVPRRGSLIMSGATPAFVTITQGPGGQQPIIDFDGNGLGDALLYNASSGAWSMRQTSAPGSFTEASSSVWGTNWTIRAANFDGNAFADLLLYNQSTGQFVKATGLGNGQFTYYGYMWADGWQPTIVDLNGDGLSDVFLYNSTSGSWFRCLTAPGASDFVYTTGLWAPGWQVYPADFNADGRADLFLYNGNASADPNSGRWFRVLSETDGSFTYVEGDIRWANGWQITPGDFDGDGRSDMFLYRGDGRWFRVTFTATGAVYAGGTWAGGWTVYAGDFNGDRLSDLFLYNTVNGQWFVVTNDPSGVVGYFAGIWAPQWTIQVSDLNADGVSDLLLDNVSNGSWFQAITLAPGLFSYNTGNWGAGWTVFAAKR